MIEETQETLMGLAQEAHNALELLVAELDGGDPDADVLLFKLIDEVSKAASQYRRDVGAVLADGYEFDGPDHTMMTDQGTVKRYPPATKDVWDTPLLLDKLKQDASFDEILEASGVTTRKSHAWKSGSLKKLGIDPANYRSRETTGAATVSVVS